MVKVAVLLPCGREITVEASPRASSLHHSAGSERSTPRKADFPHISSSGGAPRPVQCRDVIESLLGILKLTAATSLSNVEVFDADNAAALDLFRPVVEGQRLCVFSTLSLDVSSSTAAAEPSTLSEPSAANLVLSLRCLWKLQRAHQEQLIRERDEAKAALQTVGIRFQSAKQKKGELLDTLSRTKLPFKDAMVLDELNTARLDSDVQAAELKLKQIETDIAAGESSADQKMTPFGDATAWEQVPIPSGVSELQKLVESKLGEVRQLIKSYTVPRQKFAKGKNLLRAIEERVLGPFERLSEVPEALVSAEELIIRRVLLRRAVRRLLAPLEEDHRRLDHDTRDFLETSGRRLPSGLVHGLLSEPPPPLYPRDDEVAVQYDGQYIDREDDAAQSYVEKVCLFYLPQFFEGRSKQNSESAGMPSRENTEPPPSALSPNLPVETTASVTTAADAPPSRQLSGDSNTDILNEALRVNSELQEQIKNLRMQQSGLQEKVKELKSYKDTADVTLTVLREAILGGHSLLNQIRSALFQSSFKFHRKQGESRVSFEAEWLFEKYGLPYKLVLGDATMNSFSEELKISPVIEVVVVHLESVKDTYITVNGAKGS